MLLAHPERCPAFQRRPDRLVRLVEKGALCSVTAASLAGRFGRTARRYTLAMMRDGLVHDISSDAHDHERRSPAIGIAHDAVASELDGGERSSSGSPRRRPPRSSPASRCRRARSFRAGSAAGCGCGAERSHTSFVIAITIPARTKITIRT